ncbi:MAG: hypothetical protein K2R98_11945 [Gemmataceae bacterium]|nr:hypothetical protein [Gemmataceae bacterium]
MSRKSVLLALGIVLGLITVVAGLLIALVRYEPEFYCRGAVAAGDLRKQRSNEFRREFYGLANGAMIYKSWGARFTDEQINSFFEEDYLRPGSAERTFFPADLNQPRVSMETDRLRFGCRYGNGWWSTIISVDLHIWLVAKEPNVVAVEIERIRAGALPISAQSILERLSEAARRQDIEVTWYRNNGKPVALMRFQPGRRDPTVQLLQLRLQPGMMMINGADRSKPGNSEGDIASVAALSGS